MKKEKTFLGTGWAFPVTFKRKMGCELVSDEEDIRQSLSLLLSTTPKERVTLPKYGCDLMSLIFKPIGEDLNSEIRRIIREAVHQFEPRIELEEINIDNTHYLDGVVYVELIYVIRKVNVRTNMVYPFYKLEGTWLTDN